MNSLEDDQRIDLTPYENDSEALFGILDEDGTIEQWKASLGNNPDATKENLSEYLRFTDKQFDDLVSCLNTYSIETPEVDTPDSATTGSL